MSLQDFANNDFVTCAELVEKIAKDDALTIPQRMNLLQGIQRIITNRLVVLVDDAVMGLYEEGQGQP